MLVEGFYTEMENGIILFISVFYKKNISKNNFFQKWWFFTDYAVGT
ncbi:hypothetical protein BTJ45_02197 [Bacillus mycoides]|nr:hypothetical protein BTJ45_02197 [Bacillus mycoides]